MQRRYRCRQHFSVKESVFPFNKFPGVDIILGPEEDAARPGEVMGIADTFPMAFAKEAEVAANSALADVGDGVRSASAIATSRI